MVGKAVIIILVALIFRCAGVFLITVDKKFTYKERLFLAMSWVPKATV
jgi:NhaP-type Na+/H+ or K+/H+ antiporter